MEYKILGIDGYAYASDLQTSLNFYAEQGWRVIAVCKFGIILGKGL